MSTSQERIEVFQDTRDWIDNDPVLSASIAAAKKKTTVFYEDDYPDFDAGKVRSGIITVSGDRSYGRMGWLHPKIEFGKNGNTKCF